MADKYHLLLKTGQAEIKAYKNLTDKQKSEISPIIELTRGRKNHPTTIEKTKVEYNFDAILGFVEAEILDIQNFFVDVTREEALSSRQTRFRRNSTGGYKNWVTFVMQTKAKKSHCAPIIQVNPPLGQSWQEYEADLHSQFDSLAAISNVIGYRAIAKKDTTFDADLDALKSRVEAFTRAGGEFYFILDFDYIRPGTGELHAIEASSILDVVYDIIPSATPIIIATSFPNSVTDVAGEETGEFNEEEVVLHQVVSKQVHNKFTNVLFGDYGSINPTRNDAIIAANGWRPRIDYPFGGLRIFYYREKRQSKGTGKSKVFTTTYSHHYRSVAHSVVNDPRFFKDANSSDPSSWGVSEIKLASKGNVSASSPSHWISVRMNVHIQQQLRRLGLYP